MNEVMESAKPLFRMLWGAIFLVIVLKLFFWWWNSPKQKGKRGEKLVAGRLRKELPDEYRILNDIYLTLPDGTTTQIDHIVVSPVGSIFIAMQKGIARGIFSNEAGLGSAPIAAAAAKTKEPVRQGLVCMTGTFFDTIIICTMTGLAIVVSGAWDPKLGLEGVNITMEAFSRGLAIIPGGAVIAPYFLAIALVFFAFTTILGWAYYSEKCLQYLIGRKDKKAILTYRWLYIFAIFIGPYLTVSAVWTSADIFNGLMAFPNLVALILLSGIVTKETKTFLAKFKKEEI